MFHMAYSSTVYCSVQCMPDALDDVVYHIWSQYIIVYCSMPYVIVMYCMLYHELVDCSIVQFSSVQYNISVVQYSIMYEYAVYYNVPYITYRT